MTDTNLTPREKLVQAATLREMASVYGQPWSWSLRDRAAALEAEAAAGTVQPIPPEDKRKLGLFPKFRVSRVDGRDGPGQKHDGCRYFVLDMTHDPFAFDAIAAYQRACDAEYPELASDLRCWLYEVRARRLAGTVQPYQQYKNTFVEPKPMGEVLKAAMNQKESGFPPEHSLQFISAHNEGSDAGGWSEEDDKAIRFAISRYKTAVKISVSRLARALAELDRRQAEVDRLKAELCLTRLAK